MELVAQVSDLKTRVRRVALGALCYTFGIMGWVLVAGVPPLPWQMVLEGAIVVVILSITWALIRLIQAQTALDRFDNPGSGV